MKTGPRWPSAQVITELTSLPPRGRGPPLNALRPSLPTARHLQSTAQAPTSTGASPATCPPTSRLIRDPCSLHPRPVPTSSVHPHMFPPLSRYPVPGKSPHTVGNQSVLTQRKAVLKRQTKVSPRVSERNTFSKGTVRSHCLPPHTQLSGNKENQVVNTTQSYFGNKKEGGV